jgi:hypothetical protein
VLRIREEQLAALSLAAAGTFVDSVVEHVADCFPLHFQTLGRERTRRVIERVLTRGAELELIAEYDLCELVNLTFVLGDQFESDPRFAWATAVLHDTTIAAEARMRELRRRTIEYLHGARS